MPASLQISRTNANAAAAQAQQQQQTTPTPPPQHLERNFKQRVKPNHSQGRPRSFAKPFRHGNPHGNKSHRK
jgi:hypothetical protein